MKKSNFSLELDDENILDKINIDKEALKTFAKGAVDRSTSTKKTMRWQDEDPSALPDYNFRLRLNKYQIGLLKHVASIEKRSISNMIKSILLNQLEKYTRSTQ